MSDALFSWIDFRDTFEKLKFQFQKLVDITSRRLNGQKVQLTGHYRI